MPSAFHHHPSSYRDPSGFLFYKDGILYRQVNQNFKEDFEFFISSGLYAHLKAQNRLIPHQSINENFTGSGEWYTTLLPEYLSFISYPYEWCFDMLKDAALLTLEAATEAMQFGMMLKDASAYNVQWHQGKMMFIDTLSFEKYDEQKPWIAYRQFCEHFYTPLALMHYLKEPVQGLLLAYPEGIPLSLASKTLPFKSKLNLHTNLHLHLHASMASKPGLTNENTKPFSKQKMQNLLRSLKEGIRSFSFSEPSGVWSEYYSEANQRENYMAAKKEIIQRWMSDLPVKTVLDAGANEGAFSELVCEEANYVISTDFDHYSVNRFYNRIKEKGISGIHPLLIDLSNPSPSIGVNNKERASFSERTNADLVLALALIHHLAIGKNIPFNSIAEMFSNYGKHLIVEFVPKTDEKIQLMLRQKKDVYDWYTEEGFVKSFERKFTILKTETIADSGRTLYLMKAHEI
jgi:hypothetical protein